MITLVNLPTIDNKRVTIGLTALALNVCQMLRARVHLTVVVAAIDAMERIMTITLWIAGACDTVVARVEIIDAIIAGRQLIVVKK